MLGNPIFDPKGTNAFISESLKLKSWKANLPIPKKFKCMGTDIDFFKEGILIEVQFSNYPFLLNNVIRSELFNRLQVYFQDRSHVELLIIITKSVIFPASNSSLYYEQAKKQLDLLAENNIFNIPLRLVGLTSPTNEDIIAIKTDYSNERYSRTVENKYQKFIKIKKENDKKTRGKIIVS